MKGFALVSLLHFSSTYSISAVEEEVKLLCRCSCDGDYADILL